METDKIYCGSGKTRSGKYGEFQSISICLEDIPNEHITTGNNGKTYVNLTVSKKKEVDKYGKDLSVVVDTWKPESKEQAKPVTAQAPVDDSNSLPF